MKKNTCILFNNAQSKNRKKEAKKINLYFLIFSKNNFKHINESDKKNIANNSVLSCAE